MRQWINLIEEMQPEFTVTPEQAEKILSNHRLKRGTKVGRNARFWRGESEDSGSGMAMFGTGLYFTSNRNYAKQYGKVRELSRSDLPLNPFRFDSLNDYQIWEQETMEILGYDDLRSFRTAYYDVRHLVQAIDPYADGIQVYTGKDAMFVVYPVKED